MCMVGAPRPRTIDVQVVAATNKDLGALVRKEAFQEDLYFRLNVITIEIPPLRERDSSDFRVGRDAGEGRDLFDPVQPLSSFR